MPSPPARSTTPSSPPWRWTSKTPTTAAPKAIGSTPGKEVATSDEAKAQRALVAAKHKFARSNPLKLQDYYIGKRLAQTRADLEQYNLGIKNVAPGDSLPGITPNKITALNALRTAYLDTQSTQTDEQSHATTERDDRDNLIEDITDKRMQIQFAAAAQWPYNDDNAGIRKEFYLPLSRPFNG